MKSDDFTACNGVPLAELNAFREKFYPDVKVKIVVDPAIVEKKLVGLADPTGLIRLAPGILALDESKKFYSGINLTFRAMVFLTVLHELAHFILGHTRVFTEVDRALVGVGRAIPSEFKNVDEIVRELPKELQAKRKHLWELEEGCASLWTRIEYLGHWKRGVIHE